MTKWLQAGRQAGRQADRQTGYHGSRQDGSVVLYAAPGGEEREDTPPEAVGPALVHISLGVYHTHTLERDLELTHT